MAQSRLVWQIFPAFLIIITLAIGAATALATHWARQNELQKINEILDLQARQLQVFLQVPLREQNWEHIRQVCLTNRTSSEFRISVILPDGKVIADSIPDLVDLMDNQLDQPEVEQALRSGSGHARRFSETIGKEVQYYALLVYDEQSELGVVRTALPTDSVERSLARITRGILLAGLLIALISGGISLYLSRKISLPIEHMRQAAERFAEGNLLAKVYEPSSVELGDLAESLNTMGRQLHERIQTVTQQRNELEAILSSMVEGVLAVDRQGRIMSINRAGARVLGIDAKTVVGRNFFEAVRNQSFADFVEQTLQTEDTTEAEIRLTADKDITLHLMATSIFDADRRKTGVVIVLNDLTHLRRLENIRREFVANVSHELKTPITSIKGFVETLQDGGLTDPARSARFLDIIASHTDRLNAIVEDLLSLSRLEEADGQDELQLRHENMQTLLQNSIMFTDADERGVQMELECDERLQARINAALLEQAVQNLIGNALKYSQTERIIVRAEQLNDECIVRVQDFGIGIEPVHQERIFERFYVVDKARSRKVGGTGLGLALVKHIAQAHGGHVSLDSQPGHGSTFSIHLPN